MKTGGDSMMKRIQAVVLLLFLFSGISGLIYEVVWVRQLTLILGNTVLAVSTILTVFMGGLALGSFWAGRMIDRGREPLRIYAFLEISIGVCGLILTFILNQTGPVYVWIHTILANFKPLLYIARYIMAFGLLVIPTTLMGATLPVLSKFIVDRESVLGVKIGRLYALNTFGAAIGCYIAGFLLIGNLGIRLTVITAAALNVAVGSIAWFCRRWVVAAAPVEAAPAFEETFSYQDSRSLRLLVLSASGISGLAALGYEVAWTRILISYLGNSVYAFSTMLTTFLIGIALGSLILSSVVDRGKHLVTVLGFIQAAIGFYVLLLIYIFGWGAEALESVRQPLPTWQGTAVRFMKAFSILLVPTFLMGAMFPVAGRIYIRFRRIGHGIGELYAFNTVGAIIGAVVTGFVLMPILGLEISQVILLFLNLCIGIALCAVDRSFERRRAIVLAVVLAVIAVLGLALMPGNVFRRLQEVSASKMNAKLIFYKEDPVGTVTVEQKGENRRLSIDNLELAGTTGGFFSSSKSLGHLPMLLHPHPKSAFVLGFGGGGTTYAISTYPEIELIDLAELSRSVINVAPLFRAINHDVISDPRLHVEVTDGRHFLLTTRHTYDVISVDLLYPQTAGSGSLYTKEFYELCSRKLNSDGLMVEWLHYGTISAPYLRMIMRTAKEVFPYTAIWTTRRLQHFILVASKAPIRVDYDRLIRRMSIPAVQNDLAGDDLNDPALFMSYFIVDDGALEKFVEGSSQLNTDDLPVVEYKLPLVRLWEGLDNLKAIMNVKQPVLPLLQNISPDQAESISQWEQSFGYVLDSMIAFDSGEVDLATVRCRQALRLKPDNQDAIFMLNRYTRFQKPKLQ